MAVLFVSGIEADRPFVMKLARELADVVDAVQVGEHPLTTPPPPSKKPDESYSAVVAIISPKYLPHLPALKSYCDEMGLTLIPVSRYPPTDPIPRLDRTAIYFRDSYYTAAYLQLLDELRTAKVRVSLQAQRPKDHWSPLEEIRVPDMPPNIAPIANASSLRLRVLMPIAEAATSSSRIAIHARPIRDFSSRCEINITSAVKARNK